LWSVLINCINGLYDRYQLYRISAEFAIYLIFGQSAIILLNEAKTAVDLSYGEIRVQTMTMKTTIVMRSFNDSPEYVEQTLTSLSLQQGVDFDLIHLDSFSTDGTLEILKKRGGKIYYVSSSEYIPGRTLNYGMELCQGEIITFLNADATPVGPDWLYRLLKPLVDNENAIATFSRQIPRDDAEPLFRKDYERSFGDGEEHRKWKHFFSMAASAIKRSYWEKHRFDDAITSSEDIDWTYRAKLEGKDIVYVPDSIAVHSHNYDYESSYRRHRAEGGADPWTFSVKPKDAGFLRQVTLPFVAEFARDVKYAIKEGVPSAILDSPTLRWSQKLGHYHGLKDGFETAVKARAIAPPDVAAPTEGKYTVWLDEDFERKLDTDFAVIVAELENLSTKPDAIILGGGYGRREGGVLEINGEKKPYNDYDLYVVFDLKTSVVPKKLAEEVHQVSERLSPQMGLEVDLCPVSKKKLQDAEPRIEWYELRRGAWMLKGPGRYLNLMPDYRGFEIPPEEGERLLMNRAVGMIYARRALQKFKDSKSELPEDDLDFITRNIYKALLAAGDVVLLRHNLYHYSYRERLKRLQSFELKTIADFDKIKAGHAEAMNYRMHPEFKHKTYAELVKFWEESRETFKLAHRWFVAVTTGAGSWDSYGDQLLSGLDIEPKTVLNIYKNIRLKGEFPSSVKESLSLTSHPQKRVKVVAPYLLYDVEMDGENKIADFGAKIARTLFIPCTDTISRDSADEFIQSVELRFLSVWQEVN